MSRFPTREFDIAHLADVMFNGLFYHSSDFPNINAIKLFTYHRDYKTAKKLQNKKKAAFFIATKQKDRQLAQLCAIMKNDLKLSEVDTKDNPEKLSLIGWGKKAEPVPPSVPSEPTELKAVFTDIDELILQWQKTARTGGEVIDYRLERREKLQSGIFDNWQLIGISYNDQITLRDQPQGVVIEYRVSAQNKTGCSNPSNIISLII